MPARVRDRQLRLVHLQPGAVPRRARRRGRRGAQRPGDGRRDRRRRAHPPGRLARAVHAATRRASRWRPSRTSASACRCSASASATRRSAQVYGGARAPRRRAGARQDRLRSSTTGAASSRGLPDPFTATRYHSLVVDETLPDCLELSAWNDDGRRHGRAPPRAARARRAVPPRERAHRAPAPDLLRNFLDERAPACARRPAKDAEVHQRA